MCHAPVGRENWHETGSNDGGNAEDVALPQ